jgi:hypothetical protein
VAAQARVAFRGHEARATRGERRQHESEHLARRVWHCELMRLCNHCPGALARSYIELQTMSRDEEAP